MKKAGNFQEGIHNAEYLRPYLQKRITGFVIPDGSPETTLDGQWRYGIDQYNSFLRGHWYREVTHDADGRPLPPDWSFGEWETIAVPSCWNMADEKLFLYEGSIVYTTDFDFSPDKKRTFLRFGAVNYRAYIFLNKQYIGVHFGGSTPFCVEITNALRERGNRLFVVADNSRRSDQVPMENTDWFNYGGIYRSVSLFTKPDVYIKDCRVFLDAGGEITSEVTTSAGGIFVGSHGAPLSLWSPDNPVLCDIEIARGEDIFRDRVGFRRFEVSGQKLLLNGEEIYLKGVSCHEESVTHGKSVTDGEIRENFAIIKELGGNFCRLAHYPHTERAARIADEMGILLWEEIPVYWAIDFGNPVTRADAEDQLKSLIARDFNRASVVIWSVGNENPDTDERLDFMSALADTARESDPTRCVSAACLVNHTTLRIEDRLAEKLDIIGINEYYGWYEPDFSKLPKIFENSQPEKPVIITEFGADAQSGYRGEGLLTEDFQLEVYEKQIGVLGKIPCVRGITPWILYDFRCPRRLHFRQNYYNLKGLLSADKKHRKLAFAALREFYKR